MEHLSDACEAVINSTAADGRTDREAVPAVDWVDNVAALDECDGYVVLVADPQTGEVDAHGPLSGLDALARAEEVRRAFDAEDLTDIAVRVVRLHLPDGPDHSGG